MKIEVKDTEKKVKDTEETLVVESGLSSIGNFEVIGSLKSNPQHKRVFLRILKNGKAEIMESAFNLLGITYTVFKDI